MYSRTYTTHITAHNEHHKITRTDPVSRSYKNILKNWCGFNVYGFSYKKICSLLFNKVTTRKTNIVYYSVRNDTPFVEITSPPFPAPAASSISCRLLFSRLSAQSPRALRIKQAADVEIFKMDATAKDKNEICN